MTTWVGLAPAVGVGSLNGFAIGVLVSGAFSLAIIAPRRARGRRATVARDGGTLANGRPPRPSRQVMAAGPEGPVTRDDVGLSFPAGREGRAGNEYRSRHRLGDPIPDWALPRGRFRHGAPSGSAPPGSAPRDAGACRAERSRTSRSPTARSGRHCRRESVARRATRHPRCASRTGRPARSPPERSPAAPTADHRHQDASCLPRVRGSGRQEAC